MKTKLTKYLSGIIIFSLLAGTSCNSDYTINRQGEAAQIGIAVYEAAEDLYKAVDDLDYFYKYNGEYLQILIEDSTNVNFSEFGFNTEGIDEMIELTHYTQKVYRSYEMLTDINVNVKKSGIRGNFEALASRLDSFEYDNDNRALLEELKTASKSHKLERKALMFDVSSLYLDIFSKDMAARKIEMQKSLDTYDNALKMIPITAFDVKKTEPLVAAPLKDSEAIVKLYKLQLRDEAYRRQQELEKRMHLIENAIETLNRIHVEFIKQKKSTVDIDKYIIEIKEMLNIKDEGERTNIF